MLSFLKNHPFAVEAFFERSTVLTFAVPKQQLQQLIPPYLELDLFQDQWAFLAVAIVQAKGLRPKGFPKFTGHNFLLIGYRIFTRYRTISGRNLRGLYILKSETDKSLMSVLGNVFTRYDYQKTDITYKNMDQFTTISSAESDFKIIIDHATEVLLPENSPFQNWTNARRFAGPLPFTFSYDLASGKVLIVEGVREDWKPVPIKIEEVNIPYINALGLKDVVLAGAFEVTNVPYLWKKGKLEQWKK